MYSFILCFLYACSDEIHQLYVPGRSGNIKDVFVDSIGISLVLVVYYFKKRGKE
jgi:VanZ family protein